MHFQSKCKSDYFLIPFKSLFARLFSMKYILEKYLQYQQMHFAVLADAVVQFENNNEPLKNNSLIIAHTHT